MESKCGAVILAGGQGSRFGGANKAELFCQGESFLNRIKRELDMLGLPCFFSAGKYPPPREPGLEAIADLPVAGADGPIGPMGGILSCFEKTRCDLLFFLSCDLPLFHRQMAQLLMERWKPGVDAVVWRTRSGRIQPLCGLYSRSCLPALRECAQSGNYRLMHFLDQISCTVVDTAEAQIPDFWFYNVNSPEALRALEAFCPPVLAVSGTKNTGKTTLLEKLVSSLTAHGIRAAVIKHDGHDFEADVPGTDSYRMKAAGAIGTVVYSDRRYMAVKEQSGLRAADFFSLFPEADLILLEGQKNSAYPKLELIRQGAGEEKQGASEGRPGAGEGKPAPCAKTVCPPETVLAYVTDIVDSEGRPSLAGVAGPRADVPVLAYGETDRILALVVEFMDGQAKRGGLKL